QAAAPDLSTKDLDTKDLGTKDLGTKDLGTKDLGTKDLGTKDLETKDSGADENAQRAQSLLTCSGLPALFGGLAQLAPESHIGRVLMRVSQSFRDLARVGENAARHELAVLAGEDWPEGPEATVEELQAVETQVNDVLAELSRRGGQLLDDH